MEWQVGLGQLQSLGLRLRDEQLPLLDSTEGLVMRVWGVNDPYHLYCGCETRLVIDDDRNLVLPQVFALNSPDDTAYGLSFAQQLEDVYGDDWWKFPSLVGYGDRIGGDYLEDEPMVVRLWDAWPITDQMADEIDKCLNHIWYGLGFDVLETYGQWLHGIWEPEEENQNSLEQDAAVAASKITVEAIDELLYKHLSDDTRAQWDRLQRASLSGWKALLRTIRPEDRSRFMFEEGTFSPWY